MKTGKRTTLLTHKNWVMRDEGLAGPQGMAGKWKASGVGWPPKLANNVQVCTTEFLVSIVGRNFQRNESHLIAWLTEVLVCLGKAVHGSFL